jgi:hypothetical protein
MELSVLTATFAEPVNVSEVKSLMGYVGEDQDARIAKLIKVSREWLENRTGLSCISKSYKAYFERADRDSQGYYELPVSPVLATPVITVTINGVSSTFVQKGLNKVKVKPDMFITTGADDYYMEVTFQAGKPNETAFECIRRITASMFNEPEDGGVSFSRLPYDTLRLIETIDQNTGF